MASVKIVLDDIGENFLLCSICLEHFKEPKLLPCLHRFCSKCLNDYTLKHCDNMNCPVCQKKFTVPDDGFKTDFCVKNITEYVQLKQSLGTDTIRQCSGCSKELKVTAFCLKCHGVLCLSCHNLHETNNIAKDHRQHLINLDNFESSNLTMERLVSLKEDPKCSIHPEKVSELCCKSCNNKPICMACGTFGIHKGHDLHEITSLARKERAKLIEKIASLHELKEKVDKQPGVLAESKNNLDANVASKKDELSSTFENGKRKIKERMQTISENYEKEKSTLEDIFQTKATTLKSELEKEINLLKKKYDNVCNEEKREKDNQLQMMQQRMEKEKTKLEENLRIAEETVNELLTECKTKKEESEKCIQGMVDHFERAIERFENIQSTASSILAAKHDWTDMQCIPDICSAIDDLVEDIGKDIPDNISDVEVDSLSVSCIVRRSVSEKAESTATVDLGSTCGDIDSITGNQNGSIVVTGRYNAGGQNHITAIDSDGKNLRQVTIQSGSAFCYCNFLSRFIVATVSRPNEIGSFDIRNGSYNKANIPDIIGSWPPSRVASCVASDTVKNRIIVGSKESRDMYVFDGELKYVQKLTLPEIIEYPYHITVNDNFLLVCDNSGKRAFAVSIERSPCEMIYQFKKPDGDGDRCTPRSVCIDNSGFIYMLWESPYILVQYSGDGQELLSSRRLTEGDVRCLTTVEEENGEKLLVATNKEVITYNLNDG